MRQIQGGMLADAVVEVDGTALDPQQTRVLLEIKVVDSLTLPDAALMKFEDPGGALVDSGKFEIGKKVDIKLALGSRADTSVFKGEITSISSDFGRQGATLTVRAYDVMYKLQQVRKSTTFQNVTVGDAVSMAAQEASVSVSVEGSTGGVQEFIQMSSESVYDFIWRLGRAIDFELVADGADRLKFRPANGGESPPQAGTLRYGESLIAFRPRLTKMQQFESSEVRGWDPTSKQAIVGNKGSVETSALTAQIGAQRQASGKLPVNDRTVTNQEEANDLAKAALNIVANNTIEAEGTARGNPNLQAGKKVKIEGVGTKFGGDYVLSSVTHVFKGKKGYETHFVISGRTPRTLLDLMNPTPPEQWGTHCVIGTVTNNQDPDGMGRVRVKYPALGDDTEGWWARLTTLHAGNGGRGIYALPQVDDEVAVVFENGDTRRPIVVGCLYNGVDKPDAEKADRDGSMWVKSKKHIKTESTEETELHSVKNFTIKSDAELKVEVQSNASDNVQGNLESKAQGSYKISGQGGITIETPANLTLKGSMVSIEGQSMVKVSGGMIQLG